MFRTSVGVQAAKACVIYSHSSARCRRPMSLPTARRGVPVDSGRGDADDEAGRQAIDGINGHEFEGKVLTVNVARPRTERPVGQLRRQSRQWRRFRRRLQPQAVLIPERTVAAVRLFRSGAYGVPGKTPIGSRAVSRLPRSCMRNRFLYFPMQKRSVNR